MSYSPTILIDMDEVLVDFIGGAAKAFCLSREAVMNERKDNEWSITRAMGLLLDDPWFNDDKLWDTINSVGIEFWEGLEPLPWIDDVMELVQQATPDWHIATAPSRCDTSYTGKVRWLKNYFGSSFDRFIITPHKTLFARPKSILIDDRERNIHRFIDVNNERYPSTRGYGILFPTKGNSLFAEAAYPIDYLNRSLADARGHLS